MKTAHACGLSTKEDRATLACHVISRSENILRQPQWQRALNLVRERAFALRDVLEAAGIALVSPAAQHE
ncbi:hypothetical protein ACN9MU_10845 [Pseudoduganella sp. R-32]|uniref:hypothetical protein n=1 Tax=Pseudoduganella sp. R-32 TaxID=3404061 RepID=UPI003CFB08E0